MTLQLYILRQLVVGLLFAVGGMAFVAIPGIAVNAVHKLGGVSMGALLGYLPLVLVDLGPYLVPIGFLLAVVATYGRLAADHEWTAICMAGFSPIRMALPAFALGSVLSVGTLWLLGNVSPSLRFAKRSYLKSSVVQGLKSLSPGRTELKFPGTEFYLAAKHRDPREIDRFRDVLIYMPTRDGEEPETFLADAATFRFEGDAMQVRLENARRVHSQGDTTLGTFVLQADLNRLLGGDTQDRTFWKYQTSSELRRNLAAGNIHESEVRSARFEVHRRRALAATFLLFCMLGIPTGLILRKGTMLGALATAVGYALVYYVLTLRLGKTLARSDVAPEWAAAWATTVIGTVAGAIMSWRAFRR